MTDLHDRLASVLTYHERTRHLLGRYARSRGALDWANQPDPFRRFPSAPRVPLDEVPVGEGPSPTAGLDAAWNPALNPPAPLGQVSLSQLFYDALALSAWKELDGARWSLRANPSSGNLHPTEGYLISGPVPGVSEDAFLAHYRPDAHALELLRTFTPEDHLALFRTLPPGTLLVGLTSILWRESWKYGERAYRYCQLDVGHALGALAAAAALLGWRSHLLAQISDADLSALLGVCDQSGPEAEHPDALLALVPQEVLNPELALAAWGPPAGLCQRLIDRPHGHAPAPLSPEHHPWPILDAVAKAVRKGPGAPRPSAPPPTSEPLPTRRPDPPARGLIRTRRSAQALDGETAMEASAFFRLIAALLPAEGRVPQAALPWRPAVHPVLFVHRVEGLDPGLYALPREPVAERALRAGLLSEFVWERPAQAPPALPLYLLEKGDLQSLARGLLCGQDLASDGVLAVAFLADFAPRLEAEGPGFYRALHWEAGALGQVLYLEAEALGLRGTGIGCFFDAELHRVLGLTGTAWQCLYGFTLGRALDDPRLITLPATFPRDAEA